MIKSQNLPSPFSVQFPEVYQVEISSVCNLKCVMCPRTLYKVKREAFIDVALVEKLVKEDSFRGSYFVELQMSGEPLLHPQLGVIIQLIKGTGVKVGLSTNGTLLTTKLQEVLQLDFITISVDSITNYEGIRKGAQGVSELFDAIFTLIKAKKLFNQTTPAIDLQLIELPGWEVQKEKVKEIFSHEDVNIRTVNDCFLTLFDKADQLPVNDKICLNPWLSVSIQTDGTVSACCFSFWKDIVFGNVKENTLEEIWQGEEVQKLRKEHEDKKYRKICSRCYMRSPVLLHWNIFVSSLMR